MTGRADWIRRRRETLAVEMYGRAFADLSQERQAGVAAEVDKRWEISVAFLDRYRDAREMAVTA